MTNKGSKKKSRASDTPEEGGNGMFISAEDATPERMVAECKKGGFDICNDLEKLFKVSLKDNPGITRAQYMTAAKKAADAGTCMVVYGGIHDGELNGLIFFRSKKERAEQSAPSDSCMP